MHAYNTHRDHRNPSYQLPILESDVSFNDNDDNRGSAMAVIIPHRSLNELTTDRKINQCTSCFLGIPWKGTQIKVKEQKKNEGKT